MTKLAKSVVTVSGALVLALGFAGGISAQAAPAAPAPSTAMKAAAPSAKKPSAHKAKPVAAKPAVAVVPAAAPATGQTASPDQAPSGSPVDAMGPKRDPFIPLVNDRRESGGPNLPPGKAGLVVATVRVDGTVKSGNEMLAVVSNPERHVYFVREGDQLYDGDVEKIGLDGVTFRENSKDAFGKPIQRDIMKRIYPSAGEQQ